MDIRLIQRLADLILSGYLTRRFTPQDAARADWTPEQYVESLWPVVDAEYGPDLPAEDMQRLKDVLLVKIRERMEGKVRPEFPSPSNL